MDKRKLVQHLVYYQGSSVEIHWYEYENANSFFKIHNLITGEKAYRNDFGGAVLMRRRMLNIMSEI